MDCIWSWSVMTNLCPNFPNFCISCWEELPVKLTLAYEILKPKGNYRKFLGKIIFTKKTKTNKKQKRWLMMLFISSRAWMWCLEMQQPSCDQQVEQNGRNSLVPWWHLSVSVGTCLPYSGCLGMWKKKKSTSVCLHHCSKIFCFLQSNINLTDVFYAQLNM